jgi:hypothetical protein
MVLTRRFTRVAHLSPRGQRLLGQMKALLDSLGEFDSV